MEAALQLLKGSHSVSMAFSLIPEAGLVARATEEES
ncbi:hypothetical protein SAMN05421505_1209 [Sinosporangium album]|uniref:Uncharacterized protein n=1 Tax=Sinosporangium album TaxID=504805 RepID=A0A1G8EAB3_9ACTN|nr:hypothetical protein SAMN05421505_1209 [Sinosporangium album]